MIPGSAGWQQQLLSRIGAPVTPANLKFLGLWARAEGGTAANNPFNTTQPAPGASSYNSVGVRNYGSPAQGIQATAETLLNGRYGTLVGALRQGSSAQLAAKALAASPWGTGSLVEKMLGGPESAAPGSAGASVERSTGIGGAGAGSPLPGLASRAFALALLQPDGFSTQGLMRAFQARSAAQEPPGTLPSLPGANGGVTAGDPQAEPHPHGATLGWLRNFVKPYRVAITSTTDGKHAPHSYHYAARAEDVAGTHSELMRLADAAFARPHDFVEFFYTPSGKFIKNGKVYPISELDPAVAAEHYNHAHIAR